jgi:hypothetical protein
VADVVVAFQGWNSSSHGWGEGPWGEDVALPGAVGAMDCIGYGDPVPVRVARVGTVTLTQTYRLLEFRHGTIGSVTVTADANISVTGVSGTGALVPLRLRLTLLFS